MSNQITITLPDGSQRQVEAGTTLRDFAFSIGSRLGKSALAGTIDGQPVDLSTPLTANAAVQILTFDSPEGEDVYRHSTAHILAQAVKRLFPNAKLGFGPAIKDGFYYDFDLDTPFTPDDLAKIEAEIKKIIKEDYPFNRRMMNREEAIAFFEAAGEKLKAEFLRELTDPEVSIYTQGDFTDLCVGPHIPSTGVLKAFKLLKVAGAYWRGDENREMLQRIYGTCFDKQDKLDAYLSWLEEAAKRDHRKLGKELDLYSTHEEAGGGLIFYHPKGATVRNEIEDFERKEHLKRGYQQVITPNIMSSELWKISGHYGFYKENIYFTEIDGEEYAIKPMNCPGHLLIYRTQTRSYRDLPLRMFEMGTVYRYERSGALHGLLRVRGFTQDDAHIFCTPEQLKGEIKAVLDFAFEMLRVFKFDNYEIVVATRPEDSIGTDENWEMATSALTESLEEYGMAYEIAEGDGAFYGPKIQVELKDVLGRKWTGPTIQVDFNMPERFDLTYIGQDGEKHRPVMVHRTVLGSMERFIGALLENYAGAFPTWLAPVQAKVIPIAERHAAYAHQLAAQLIDEDIRVEVDDRSEKVGYKIREAQVQKIPYMLVVGDQEMADQTVAVRKRGEGDLGSKPVNEFISELRQEIKEKR